MSLWDKRILMGMRLGHTGIALWFFDWLAGVMRMLHNGLRRTKMTDIGPAFVRVDIPGILWASPSHCAFIYFPKIHPLIPWENHHSLLSRLRC